VNVINCHNLKDCERVDFGEDAGIISLVSQSCYQEIRVLKFDKLAHSLCYVRNKEVTLGSLVKSGLISYR